MPPVPTAPTPPAPAPRKPALAPHFERIVLDRHLRDGRALAQALAVTTGQRVLELGCGTGLLSRHLVRCVGPHGEVLGLDPLPLRIQIAHQHGGANLRFQVGDAGQPAQLARFAGGSFDAIVANGVVHRWHDAPATLAQCTRLLAPGGRLGIVVASADHPHPARSACDAVLAWPAYAGHPWPPEAREYGLNEAALRQVLEAAGLTVDALEVRREVLWHATATAALEFMQAHAWGRFLQHLPEDLRAAAQADVLARLDSLRGPAGIRHEAVSLLAVASRPALPLAA